MYHSIIMRRTKAQDDTYVDTLTFRTKDIKEISIQRDSANIPVKGWLTLDTVAEGENYVVTFTRDHHPEELEMLDVLNQSLINLQTYFRDEQGNVFPFDNILYVSAAHHALMMEGNVKIVLHPQNEWPVFINDYINWMDLHK